MEEYATDHNTSALLLALKDIAAAQGGLGKLAQQTNLNRAHIYKALSREGNPRLDTLEKILNSLGFRLSIEPLAREKQKPDCNSPHQLSAARPTGASGDESPPAPGGRAAPDRRGDPPRRGGA